MSRHSGRQSLKLPALLNRAGNEPSAKISQLRGGPLQQQIDSRVGAFDKKKVLEETFSVIVKTSAAAEFKTCSASDTFFSWWRKLEPHLPH